MAKKRIFIGLPASQKLKVDVNKWQDTNLTGTNLRIISPNNLHITLVPPWYVDEKVVKKVVEKLQNFNLSIGSFPLYFNKVEIGPSKNNPKLIWAVGKTPKKLLFLKEELNKILTKENAKRKFKLHLTIARFKKESVKKIKIQEVVFWKDMTGEFCLYESKLSPKGANYKILKSFNI